MYRTVGMAVIALAAIALPAETSLAFGPRQRRRRVWRAHGEHWTRRFARCIEARRRHGVGRSLQRRRYGDAAGEKAVA